MYDPVNAPVQIRGVGTGHLDVYQGEFRVRANRFARLLRRRWDVMYDWPTVVVQHIRPIPSAAVLFELDGRLASAAVLGKGKRLVEVLRSADFHVIEVSRLGWEAPAPVSGAELAHM